MKKGKVTVSAFFAALLLGFLATSLIYAQTASPGIRIRADGSVDPASTSIRRDGSTYTFTADIFTQGIVVEKPNIVLDGAGFTLKGPYNGQQTLWIIGEGPNQTVTNETWSIGVDLLTSEVGGLTVRNLRVENFSIGMYLWAPNCSSIGNRITNTIVGIMVSGVNSMIVENYFGENKNGIYFGSTGSGNIPEGIEVFNNSFVNNTRQLGGCICVDYNLTEAVHNWDSGRIGNFWSDYNGTDANGDGIGDTPYNIDVLNLDRFPLMQIPGVPPTPTPPKALSPETMWHMAVGIVAGAAIVVAVALVLRRKRKLPS